MPVIKCFSKGHNVNILNILHVHRRRFRTITMDTHVPETVPRFYKADLLSEMAPVLMGSERNGPPVEFVIFSVCPISGGLQSTFFARTIDYLVNNCLMNIKMKSNMINVEISFRHTIHSAAFVSGRLLRFHTKISSNSCHLLMSAFQWPCKHVLIGNYFPNPDKRGSHYYRTCYDKAAFIISQAWLWADS